MTPLNLPELGRATHPQRLDGLAIGKIPIELIAHFLPLLPMSLVTLFGITHIFSPFAPLYHLWFTAL
ncbi:hypothetical protein C1T17_03535 [Sphingobium sp. SCG-1]|uniref:hypothetical protein n=1 Tax=Sphingobium sp. SCG-1 TaxID=2072936 RepID=UPI000CD6B26D|nr:hypothetical protein [Sphingobium sp. SCG-1]AUW57302.1 hypothetical protein C1T17_03535 [Sphingobium sp. SCG-1]